MEVKVYKISFNSNGLELIGDYIPVSIKDPLLFNRDPRLFNDFVN